MRKEGQIARSQDLFGAAAQAGLLLAIVGPGLWMMQGLGETFGPSPVGCGCAGACLGGNPANRCCRGCFLPPLAAMAPLFLLPMVAVLLMVTLQRAWLVTPRTCNRNCRAFRSWPMPSTNSGRMACSNF